MRQAKLIRMTKAASAPTNAEIRVALSRILDSASFAQAGRASGFLRYVVEETLAGRSDRLKGLTIAVDVFERPADFDAQSDPLVRVEASRLRRRLLEYYAGEGREDPVRISLTRGSYIPAFRHTARGPRATDDRGRQFSVPMIGLAIVVVLGLVMGIVLFDRQQAPADPLAGTPAPVAGDAGITASAMLDEVDRNPPRLVVLPVRDLSGSADYQEFAAGITEELNSALVAYSILATVSPNVESSAGLRLSELRSSFRAGYVLLGSVRVADGRIRLVLRAMDTGLGTQFWTMTIDETITADMISQQQRLAVKVAQIMASPFGPVFTHEIERIAKIPTDELNSYQCLMRFYDYARSFDPGLFTESVRCIERTTTIDPQFAEAWAAQATLYLHEYSYGFVPRGDYREPPLERALEAVRNSLDINGNGRVAAITLAGIQRVLGNQGEFGRAVERALSLQPSHPAVNGQIGMLLILNGDVERGRPLLESAIESTSNVPGWYYVAHCFGALEQGQYEAALQWGFQIDAPTWFAAPLAVAASAALAGRPELATREVARLQQIDPDFARHGRERLARWLPAGPLQAILIDGLERAGLALD